MMLNKTTVASGAWHKHLQVLADMPAATGQISPPDGEPLVLATVLCPHIIWHVVPCKRIRVIRCCIRLVRSSLGVEGRAWACYASKLRAVRALQHYGQAAVCCLVVCDTELPAQVKARVPSVSQRKLCGQGGQHAADLPSWPSGTWTCSSGWPTSLWTMLYCSPVLCMAQRTVFAFQKAPVPFDPRLTVSPLLGWTIDETNTALWYVLVDVGLGRAVPTLRMLHQAISTH